MGGRATLLGWDKGTLEPSLWAVGDYIQEVRLVQTHSNRVLAKAKRSRLLHIRDLLAKQG